MTTRKTTAASKKNTKTATAVEPAESAAPKRARTRAAKKKESVAESAHLPPNALKILQAISEKKVVELVFLDADANAPRNFEPRSLSFESLEQTWYVWGWDRRYNADRHHRLDALAEVSMVDGVGRAAQGPYPVDAPPNHIGGWLGGDTINVKVMLSKQWAHYVRQAPAPFPEFTIKDADDGRVQVSFAATDFRAVARWCMQFGDGIQVIEPARLAERLRQAGLAWGAKFQVAPAAPTPQHSLKTPIESDAFRPKPETSEELPPKKQNHLQPAQPTKTTEDAAPKSKPSAQRVEIRIERL
ncbi:MAG: WYL domain-containing protein [Holophagales bacterium]|jgi:predicted DNA-binding transcriptional regulator YafY|nr:WYL domain-containing protein [Holophagales bacterium]